MTSPANVRAFSLAAGKIGDLRRDQVRKRSAESKDGAVCFTLMNLSAEHRNAVLREFRFDALQRAGPDGRARAGK